MVSKGCRVAVTYVTITAPFAFTQRKTTCVNEAPMRSAALFNGTSTGPPGNVVIGLHEELIEDRQQRIVIIHTLDFRRLR